MRWDPEAGLTSAHNNASCQPNIQHDSATALIMNNAEKHSSKPKRSRDKDGDKKSKKRHKNDDEEHKSKKRKRKDEGKLRITDDDPDDEDMWVEKNVDMDGTKVRAFSFKTLSNSDGDCRFWRQTFLRLPVSA